MIFVRKGPRYLFFRSLSSDFLQSFLEESLNGELTELSDALEKGKENDTIVFLFSEKKSRKLNNYGNVIYIPHSPFLVMELIINRGITDKINRVDSGAGQMVMRIPQDGNQVINEIKDRYKARSVDLLEAINQGTADDTILSFTDKPIRNKVNSLNLIKENLLISRPAHILLHELRRDAVRYITHGLEEDQWYELRINIYDSRDRYLLQYQRLSLILSDLEAGFILGESWTKDHAIALLSVIAYQVRLFTFLSPEEIKNILLSLEYDNNGQRLVDYDLYYKNKKINWYKVSGNREKTNRVSLALEMRENLMTSLSIETRKGLNIIEKQLVSDIDFNK